MESMTDWAFSWPISARRLWLAFCWLGGKGGPPEGIGYGKYRGVRRTLVVVYHVAKVVAPTVVSFAHAHGVVREVDIAVVTEDWEIVCQIGS